MKKYFGFLLIVLATACSERDEKFCKCLEVGNELNAFSAKLLSNGASETTAKKLKEIKSRKQKACEDYITMDGPEMIKKKAACVAN